MACRVGERFARYWTPCRRNGSMLSADKRRRFGAATSCCRPAGRVLRARSCTGRASDDDMIDLHCHILPGIDDGAADLSVSLEMARAFVADGVSVVACTPHILPGLYHNSGPQIRQAVAQLQQILDKEGIPLRLVTGADNHIVPSFVAELRSGHLLSLADSRYVLVEPPHHVAPPRLEDLFFNILVAGYVPILTHPERLSWIKSHYQAIQRLVASWRLDTAHGRLACWSFRSKCAILGRTNARRGMRAYSGYRRS